jgi:hypothetical protein
MTDAQVLTLAIAVIVPLSLDEQGFRYNNRKLTGWISRRATL